MGDIIYISRTQQTIAKVMCLGLMWHCHVCECNPKMAAESSSIAVLVLALALRLRSQSLSAWEKARTSIV